MSFKRHRQRRQPAINLTTGLIQTQPLGDENAVERKLQEDIWPVAACGRVHVRRPKKSAKWAFLLYQKNLCATLEGDTHPI